MKTLDPCRTIQADTYYLVLKCVFHHPRCLKTTCIQSNPIKEGYKTHTCQARSGSHMVKKMHRWAGHTRLSLKLRFVQEGAKQGI
jgi:hypothetical protein